MQAQVQQIIDEVLSYDEDADTGNLEKIKNKLGNLKSVFGFRRSKFRFIIGYRRK